MPNDSFDLGIPKGMRRRDYTAGFEHGRLTMIEERRRLEDERTRLEDLLECYGAHLDQLHHTRLSQRGMLRKQGKEIVRLRRTVEGQRGALDSMQRTNSRLARAFNSSSEVLWQMAGKRATGMDDIAKLARMARSALAERIRDENR